MSELILVAVMAVVALITGTFLEKRHYKSIYEREEKLR